MIKDIIQKWLHDKLGRGYPSKHRVGGNNYQPVFECRLCAGELAQDSQGNWFHLNK